MRTHEGLPDRHRLLYQAAGLLRLVALVGWLSDRPAGEDAARVGLRGRSDDDR